MKIYMEEMQDEYGNTIKSTEELLAEVERLNEEGLDDDDVIGSMDVEALYPSLDIDFTVDKVCEIIYGSSVRYVCCCESTQPGP